MRCMWKELLALLPPAFRAEADAVGEDKLQEIRLRLKEKPELVTQKGSIFLENPAEEADLNYVINAASRYSPWSAGTVSEGYLTAPGGHRIGVCGEAVIRNGNTLSFRRLDSLCIRVAKDITGIPGPMQITGSALILGAPGWGKSTLLRDLARKMGDTMQVCVVDERRELFPEGFLRGRSMDVLSGCGKEKGISMCLRTMGPACIAVDEITEASDCGPILHAASCGITILATAHGKSREDLKKSRIYRPLLEIFDTLILLHQDKSWHMERMAQ